MLMDVTNHLKWPMLGSGGNKLIKSNAAPQKHTAPGLRYSCCPRQWSGVQGLHSDGVGEEVLVGQAGNYTGKGEKP